MNEAQWVTVADYSDGTDFVVEDATGRAHVDMRHPPPEVVLVESHFQRVASNDPASTGAKVLSANGFGNGVFAIAEGVLSPGSVVGVASEFIPRGRRGLPLPIRRRAFTTVITNDPRIAEPAAAERTEARSAPPVWLGASPTEGERRLDG